MEKPITNEEIISDYLDAFRSANPDSEAPTISYDRGWFRFRYAIGYDAPYRKVKMLSMTETLRSRVNA